jgi:hypothetical protein
LLLYLTSVCNAEQFLGLFVGYVENLNGMAIESSNFSRTESLVAVDDGSILTDDWEPTCRVIPITAPDHAVGRCKGEIIPWIRLEIVQLTPFDVFPFFKDLECLAIANEYRPQLLASGCVGGAVEEDAILIVVHTNSPPFVGPFTIVYAEIFPQYCPL